MDPDTAGAFLPVFLLLTPLIIAMFDFATIGKPSKVIPRSQDR